MAGSKKAVLLINTHSRKGKDLLVHAEKSLRDHGVEVTRTHALEGQRQIDDAVAGIVGEGADLLIVGSGDGTISEVVDHSAYKKTTLGYIPLGTSNNFARRLGIPLEVEGAIDSIANGKVTEIDLGK